MSVIEGLSHIVLTTSSVKKYEDTSKFYSLFGYQPISHVGSQVSANEVSQFLPRNEKVLHLFGKPPSQDITIKIVLTTNANEKEPFPEEKDWRLEQTSLVSATKNITV
jgi:hypothetical protein